MGRIATGRSATRRRTLSRTARSASDSAESRALIRASRRGGTPASATVRTPASSGGTAVSGSTDAPAPAATRSPMRRMPSTSTVTARVTPWRAAALSTSVRSGLLTGGSTSPSRVRSSSDTGPAGSRASVGTTATSASSRRVSATRRRSLTGSVTIAWASSPPITSAARRSEAASLTRSRMPGARTRSAATRRGTIQRLAVPTVPKLASPTSSPWSMDRSTRSASSSRRTRRARSMTRSPHSVGMAPRRVRVSSSAPSSASSWRTCSETLDCTVASESAAAVKEPCSAMARRVSRWRSSMSPTIPSLRTMVRISSDGWTDR